MRSTMYVRDPRGQGRDVAFSPFILSTGHCVAVARQQNCMVSSDGSYMCVCGTVYQCRDAASPKRIISKSDRVAIACNQHTVTESAGKLDVRDTVRQRWDVALTKVIIPTSYGGAVTLQQYRVSSACGNMCVNDTCRQGRNVALPLIIFPQVVAVPSLLSKTVCVNPAAT